MPSIEPKPAIAVKRRASPSRQNLPGDQTGSPKKAPPNPSYTVRVICCVIFIFLTEICLAHYIYRLINSEMRSDYVKKDDFRLYLMREIHSESGRDEIFRLIREISASSEYPQRNSNTTSNSGVSYNNNNINNNNSGSNRRKKRSSSSGSGLNNYNSLSSTSPARGDEPHVEFFNPELRGTLEAQDELSRQNNGGKGSAPGGDSWIWLTSNSRIPEKVLEGYCKKVNQFCPPGRPGPVGPPGNPGFKGERGDKGFPGIPGQMGHRGLPGLPGVKGAKGDQGRNGLDGRDGIPGEPGLDGLPGRNGHDGLPGIDGLPGFPGKDGRNGTDGRPGLPGPQGPQGPQGPRGIAGPRGRPGRPGNHGIPGIPGISTYKIKGGNGSADLLIPPSIAGAQSGPMGPISVAEGSNVRLHCSATGVPTPHVTWQRLSNKPINRGAWEDIAVSGHTLNITKVNREHMGIYLCIADNGIPPQANQTFNLEVEFPPLVRITNQMVGVVNGTTAVLECETEAFPEPVRYWERSDGRLLENGEKYRIYNGPMEDEYKGKMQLNITRVGPADFSYLYYCVSKNAHQSTRGEFTLYELDPRKPSQIFDTSGKVTVYGAQPPDKVSLEDLCGPPVLCPECHPAEKETKCDPISGGVSLIDLVSRWDVRPFGDGRYTGYPNRSMDCVLYAVGKPVYHRSSNYTYGCWMRDAHALTDKDGEKFWVTNEDEPTHLYQFDNKTVYRDDFPSRTHDLPIPFQGNTHIFYHGSFFYNAKNSNMIVRYSPSTNNTASYSLPFVYKENMTKLYVTRHNYMDFNVDDNGVWVIFPVPDSGNLAVMKFDPVLMKPQHIWNITVNHHKVGEMFIVCGVLYAVDSVQDKNTKIRFALDLYKSVLLDVELTFSNPFKKTTMLGYNHKNKELYSWDKGNQLTYPVRYHEIGYNYSSKEEKNDFDDGHLAESQIGTGYEIN